MIILPEINPIALQLGSVQIHWYGVCYALSFILGYLYLIWQANWSCYKGHWDSNQIVDLLIFVAVGVILGARAGYVILYQPQWLLSEPWKLFYFWDYGRSFHAGVLSVMLCIWLFCWVYQRKFFMVTDFLVPAVPIGIFFGRIGNFINGELWGRVANGELPWAMVLPYIDALPRHPSQLYEALLEGLLLWAILALVRGYTNKVGVVSATFFIGYGIFRVLAEFFREPDLHQGFIFTDWLTMGQLLSLPMILIGLILLVWALIKKA